MGSHARNRNSFALNGYRNRLALAWTPQRDRLRFERNYYSVLDISKVLHLRFGARARATE